MVFQKRVTYPVNIENMVKLNVITKIASTYLRFYQVDVKTGSVYDVDSKTSVVKTSISGADLGFQVRGRT